MGVKLYKHNEETYEKMTHMFEAEKKVAVVQPTGTGKSFLILKWIEDHSDESILILSPSTEIFTQLERYANEEKVNLNRIKMHTYAALNVAPKEYLEGLIPTKIILDEFHRTGAEQWGDAVNTLLSLNPDAKVLGVTATPVRYLDGARDMSSEIFNGNIARYMNLGEAVEMGILPTPIYVPVWYDYDDKLNQYQESIDEIEDDSKRKEAEDLLKILKNNLSESYGAEDIFEKYMSTNGKYLVFCKDEEHLNQMKNQMIIWLRKVNTSVNTYITLANRSDKDDQIQNFINDNSNSVKLLFSIDRLNEGLHVPEIDGVIMLRPTDSPIIYLQQMGRALAVGNKQPLIFDMVNNYQSVKAIDSNGASVNVFEKEIYTSAKNRGITDAPVFKIFEHSIEFSKLFEALETILFIDNDMIWYRNFEVLKMFIADNDRLPKSNESYNGINIGSWYKIQKQSYTTGKLSCNKKRELLKSIGVESYFNDTRWYETFEVLKMFIADNDRIPKQGESYNGINIGLWCKTQKSTYRKGKLSKDRKKLLESVGMIF